MYKDGIFELVRFDSCLTFTQKMDAIFLYVKEEKWHPCSEVKMQQLFFDKGVNK
jgi:hypothetical protein